MEDNRGMFVPDHIFTLLVVDDDPLFQRMIKTIFSEDHYIIHKAESGEEAILLMTKIKIDAAIIDLNLPGIDGMKLLKIIKPIYPDIMIIMLTGQGNIQLAVEAVKAGVVDFLQKPFPQEELRIRIDKLYQMWLLKEENTQLKSVLKFDYEALVGNSVPMLELKKLIARVGPTNTSILIQGDTGTGKELVAKAVHYHSQRRNKPFVVVDCAAISSTVIESELFGHVRGSFTGAIDSVKGLIRSADGGTLFFDEIGELDLAVQAKLLRVLQEREVRPLGSPRTFPINVRILAATNRNLRIEVEQGRFREDLFYRIQVLTIEVPPLRSRKADIAMLAEYILKKNGSTRQEGGNIASETLTILTEYNWPGNVRELENILICVVSLGKNGLLLPEDLPPLYSSVRSDSGSEISNEVSESGSLADYEKNAIINALNLFNGNRRKTAEKLNIGEATLYRKIKKYEITGI